MLTKMRSTQYVLQTAHNPTWYSQAVTILLWKSGIAEFLPKKRVLLLGTQRVSPMSPARVTGSCSPQTRRTSFSKSGTSEWWSSPRISRASGSHRVLGSTIGGKNTRGRTSLMWSTDSTSRSSLSADTKCWKLSSDAIFLLLRLQANGMYTPGRKMAECSFMTCILGRKQWSWALLNPRPLQETFHGTRHTRYSRQPLLMVRLTLGLLEIHKTLRKEQ